MSDLHSGASISSLLSMERLLTHHWEEFQVTVLAAISASVRNQVSTALGPKHSCESAGVGGHCHSFCVQGGVTGVVESTDPPFTFHPDTVHSKEQEAGPVGADLSGEECLVECKCDQGTMGFADLLRDIARHIQVADPQDFHGLVFLQEFALLEPQER